MLHVATQHSVGGFTLDARIANESGGVTALYGPSGAGKSTILGIVGGLVQPTHATVVVGDTTLLDTARRVHVPMEQRRIGWVFQDSRLFPHLTVADNLDYGAHRAVRLPASAAVATIERDAVIATLGIGALLSRKPHTLSGGERQRVALGRALLARPRLLLLDEPLASLDMERREEILELIDRIKREFRVPMIYVTHSLGEVLRVADHLVVLENGRVAEQGPVDRLLANAQSPSIRNRPEFGAVLTGDVIEFDPARFLAVVRVGDALLQVSASTGVVGSTVRVHVPAREVILATARPARVSVRNVLPCQVLALTPTDTGTVHVQLALGATQLVASITADAVRELELTPGIEVFALIKSASVDLPAGARSLRVS